MTKNQFFLSKPDKALNITDKFILFFYALYFILNPFYLWRSGLPQIADLVLIFSLVIYIFSINFKVLFNRKNKQILFTGLFFIVWVVLINSIWMLKTQQNDGFLLSTIFYIYNYIVFCFVLVLVKRYELKILKITYGAVVFSIIIQLIVYLNQGGFEGARNSASFNNPNQLGYYGLIMLSFLIFLSSKINVKLKWLLISLPGALLLIFSSLSKAAIVSVVGLITVYIFSYNPNRIIKNKILTVTILLMIFLGVFYNKTSILQNNELINSVQSRIEGIGEDSDDNLAGRGYDRIFSYPEYWLFGAGEGNYSRFNNQKMEFHSTLGNIQVSYGFIGLLLFNSLIFITLKNKKYTSWYIMLFLMIYGLTHNGIRNSLLWILLAIMNYKEENGEIGSKYDN